MHHFLSPLALGNTGFHVVVDTWLSPLMGGENNQCTRLPASGKDALISGMEPRPSGQNAVVSCGITESAHCY